MTELKTKDEIRIQDIVDEDILYFITPRNPDVSQYPVHIETLTAYQAKEQRLVSFCYYNKEKAVQEMFRVNKLAPEQITPKLKTLIPKWEYVKQLEPNWETLERLGEKGWELVTVTKDNLYIFKRQKQ